MAESFASDGEAEETPQGYFRRTMAERYPKEWEIDGDGQTYNVEEAGSSSRRRATRARRTSGPRPLFDAFAWDQMVNPWIEGLNDYLREAKTLNL